MREQIKDKERLQHIVDALIQNAERMKKRGYDTDEICKITGLSREEIERL